MIRTIATLLPLFALAACAEVGTPLVFVSEVKFGATVKSPTPDNPSAELSVGLRTRDAAYVPTMSEDKKSGKHSPIRGCYRRGVNVGKISQCNGSETGNSAPRVEPTQMIPTSKSHLKNLTSAKQNSTTVEIKHSNHFPKRQAQTQSAKMINLDTMPSATKVAILGTPPEDIPPGGELDETVTDALSVFSSFSSDTEAATTITNKLGKFYATGVAAQHLTDGISVSERRRALAALTESTSKCIKELKDAKGAGKVTGKDIEQCSGEATKIIMARNSCIDTLKKAKGAGSVTSADLQTCNP